MSMFRRIAMAKFRSVGGGGGGTHTLTAGNVSLTNGDGCIDAYYGYSAPTQLNFGSISPTTLSGFTILNFYYVYIEALIGFPTPTCQPSIDSGFYFKVQSYTGTQTSLFTSFTYQKASGGTATLTSSGATTYAAGEWYWLGSGSNYEPTSGAITFT